MRLIINRDSVMRKKIIYNFLIKLCNTLILKTNNMPDAEDNYHIGGIDQCIIIQWVNVSVALYLCVLLYINMYILLRFI